MKRKYYGFDGERLIYIGDAESLSSILDSGMVDRFKNPFFYVASIDDWKELLERMNKSILHEFQ